jgi:hypothetical protein
MKPGLIICSALFALAGLLFSAGPAMAVAQGSTQLAAVDLGAVKPLGFNLAPDKSQAFLGDSSLKVEAAGPLSLCLAVVDDLAVDDCRLVYQARVKCRGLRGRAYLEMWLHFADGGIYFSRGLNNFVSGDSDWTALVTPFFLKKGQKPVKATLNLVVQGVGAVWIDDLRLLKLPLE